ncbi:toll/interleukin-1 receptor domain-containing protein [Streptomyces chartreusis]|uniref:toll/interleukin-1 receptor domain-containing protein n=1 Tax=Streptomyces chartreusis TaxID=1969 RepID=UPI00364E4D50
MAENEQTWDVFLSHASEDKEAVVRLLAEALERRGVEVWHDQAVLCIGDSLRRKIDHGMVHKTFGIAVLSKPFFAKGWPQYELDVIISQSVSGDQRMLPIWHEISKTKWPSSPPLLSTRSAATRGPTPSKKSLKKSPNSSTPSGAPSREQFRSEAGASPGCFAACRSRRAPYPIRAARSRSTRGFKSPASAARSAAK